MDDLSGLKELVWIRERSSRQGLETADVPFGFRYRVFKVRANVFWQYGVENMHPCDSIDHGKELCWRDYQSRVRGLFE